MARISRKAVIMQEQAQANTVPVERVYNVAIYARLSVEDNNRAGDQESITMQQFMLEKFVSAQPDMRLADVFCDNGETGTNFERPGFERMMDEIRLRKVDCIVVKDLSRFGRNYVEAGYYLEKIFPFLGVRFVAVNDSYDTSKNQKGNELIVSLKNLVNDLYAKDISQKINSSLETKQKNGEFIGAFAPYGYDKSLEDKHKLVIDPEAAQVVRDIFRWKAEGVGNNLIARRLNEQGVPSPSMHHYTKGHYSKRKPSGAAALWQGQIIKLITGNITYTGNLAQGKTKKSLSDGMPTTKIDRADWIIVRDTHEAIIDEETFDKVNALKEELSAKIKAQRGKYPTTENVFRGLLVCGDCGTKLNRYKGVSPAGTARYTFICRVYAENLSAGGCTMKCVGEPELVECVFQVLKTQIKLAVNLEKLLLRLQSKPEFLAERKALADRIAKVKREITRNNTLRGSLFEAFREKHTINEQEYLSMKQEFSDRIQVLEQELAQLAREEYTYSRTLTPQNTWIQAVKKYKKEKVITRKMAVELIHHITVYDYNKIEITWNFEDEFSRVAQDRRYSERVVTARIRLPSI